MAKRKQHWTQTSEGRERMRQNALRKRGTQAQEPKADAPSLSSLCVFLKHGRTFTFRDVTVKSDNEYAITFSYTAMSDGLTKHAAFYKENVVGISRVERANQR